MITPNPRCFGVWGVIGKRAEVEKPNRVAAKCAILKIPQRVYWRCHSPPITSPLSLPLPHYHCPTIAAPLSGRGVIVVIIVVALIFPGRVPGLAMRAVDLVAE
jgi:hypothetical protein